MYDNSSSVYFMQTEKLMVEHSFSQANQEH